MLFSLFLYFIYETADLYCFTRQITFHCGTVMNEHLSSASLLE